MTGKGRVVYTYKFYSLKKFLKHPRHSEQSEESPAFYFFLKKY